MRISRFGLLSGCAALALMSALPCLGQSALMPTPIQANAASGLNVTSVQQKMQQNLQQHLQQELGRTFSAKMLPPVRIMVAPVTSAQRECYDLKVFRFRQGYPENNAMAQPSVSECESATHVHLKNLVTGVKVLQMTPKH